MKVKLFFLFSSLILTSSFVSPVRRIFRKTKYCISRKSRNILKNSLLLGDNIYKATTYNKKKLRVATKKQANVLKKDLYKESDNNFKIIFLEQFCLAIDEFKYINELDKEVIKLGVSSIINKKIYFDIPIKNILISFTFHSLFSHTIYTIKVSIINSPIYNSPQFQYLIHIFKN